MKKFISFDQFVNEKHSTNHKTSINEATMEIKGHAYNIWNDKKIQRELNDIKFRIIGDINKILTISGDKEELDKVKSIFGLNESKNTGKVDFQKLKAVEDHLKKQGIISGDDYEYVNGLFMAKNMDVAQNMADAIANKFYCTIDDDAINDKGQVPVSIKEEMNVVAATALVSTAPTPSSLPPQSGNYTSNSTTQQAPKTKFEKEDVKGFHKLDSIKKDIESSKVALEKMKTLISKGVKDKKLTESYIELLRIRTNLINEMNDILEKTKQSITNKN
jgi:hypothetical protein